MSWIQTYGGRAFYPLDPDPDGLDPADIAHSLALQCRFNGHCRVFYSVAEHSVRVSHAVPPDLALWGLLHDATEAYVGDLPRPIKQQLPQYRQAENDLMRVVADRFGLVWPMPQAVLEADTRLLATEARDLMAPPPEDWGRGVDPLPERIDPLPAEKAEQAFLARYAELQAAETTAYDSLYGELSHAFGSAMAPLLADHLDLLAPRSRVLDIGVGQGRNALALAQSGHAVVGIDPSPVAVETVRRRAAELGVEIDCRQGGYQELEADESFDVVLMLGLAQMLPRPAWPGLLERARRWARPGGLLLLTGWHVGDPRYAEVAAAGSALGDHSFLLPDGRVRSYFAAEEVLDWLEGFQLVYHWEGLGPWHRHGEGDREQHGTVRVVARRT